MLVVIWGKAALLHVYAYDFLIITITCAWLLLRLPTIYEEKRKDSSQAFWSCLSLSFPLFVFLPLSYSLSPPVSLSLSLSLYLSLYLSLSLSLSRKINIKKKKDNGL